ncbi:hypothetical protein SAMN06265379_101178 [Saccharicrinis carchari]|uniref:Uncharacterized protein n=1 Tax=Saccharicrinis carchari TaxID=1168039 RepID=A0A521AJC9_SACCC|nr:hypothetical protein SAMN06265379_101178 [Saccharicrinis carchari]
MVQILIVQQVSLKLTKETYVDAVFKNSGIN